MTARRSAFPVLALLLVWGTAVDAQDPAAECDDWETQHPEWIFCDTFESAGPLVGDGRYFEYVDDDGEFVPLPGAGLAGSTGMRVLWQAGEVAAGNLKLGFGRNPSGYMNRGIRDTEDFREVFYRTYLRMQAGWEGQPAKLSRATVIAADDWSQAMIAHLWEGSVTTLGIDPVRCVGTNDQYECIGYNDFPNMDWLGHQSGITPVFDTAVAGGWHCVEAHVRLNDPGLANGVQEFWIDGQLETRADTLDFVRGYSDYAINAIFFENWWNSGSDQLQERYIDNIVVSTAPVGCLVGNEPIFSDGFESGDTSTWSVTVE